MMAWLNNIPGPSSQPHKGKEPEQTEQTEPNQCSSIMIDGDEKEVLWGSCMNPWGMEFGLRPAQQHTSPKHSNDDKKQGENSFQ